MTSSRVRVKFTAALLCAWLAGCGARAEPELPRWDPLEKIRKSEGWKVGRGVAVSAGPVAHHVQALTSGLHDVDFDTPPAGINPVTPRCRLNPARDGAQIHLVIGSGSANFHLMDKPDYPSLVTFNTADAEAIAQKQAQQYIEKGTRSTSVTGRQTSVGTPLRFRNIIVTETRHPVLAVIADPMGAHVVQNFVLAPGAQLAGVVVYTKTDKAAVMGVPDGVPVDFVSGTHPATKACMPRIQARPDESWGRQGDRHKALKPHYRAFKSKIQQQLGHVDESRVVSVSAAGHILLGPAPTRYEDRVPFTAWAGKTVHFIKTDHAIFGTDRDTERYGRDVLDDHYEKALKTRRAGLKG